MKEANDYKLIHTTFSKEKSEKINEIEKLILPIYKLAYNWDFTPTNYEEKINGLRDLLRGDKALLLQKDEKNIGFITYKDTIFKNSHYLYILELSIIPAFQGRGLSKMLLENLVTKMLPDIIYGESQNHRSVISRNKVLSELNYQTYWAEEAVSKGSTDKEKAKEISRQCVKIFDPENYQTYDNGVKEYTIFNCPIDKDEVVPKDLQEIYNKIVRISDQKYSSAFGVLVSIRNEV